MRKQSMDFLQTLLKTPSPSGFELENQKNWIRYAKQFADEVRTDSYGNAVAILNPKGSPKIMLDSHIDEIGFILRYIDDKGFISFQNIGGVDPAIPRGKRVNIHNENGAVRGIVAAPPIHLRDLGVEPKVPKTHELFIDIGAKSKKEALKRVSVGDPITFVDGFEMLTDDIAVSRAMDNKAGAWAVLEALRLASSKKLNCAIYACSSVQEETGLNGVQMQVHQIQPDAAIAIDVTHATDIPGINVKEHGDQKIGDGPVVFLGRENHPLITKQLRSVCKKKKIPHQVTAFNSRGGNDGWEIWTKQGGIPTAVVSIPNRYMHTPVEMVSLSDLQNTAILLAEFCLSLKLKHSFNHKF